MAESLYFGMIWDQKRGKFRVAMLPDPDSGAYIPLMATKAEDIPILEDEIKHLAKTTGSRVRMAQFDMTHDYGTYRPDGTVEEPPLVEPVKAEEKPHGKQIGLKCGWCDEELDMAKEYSSCPKCKLSLSTPASRLVIYEEEEVQHAAS